MENSLFISSFTLALILYLTLNHFFASRIDPREPPLVTSKIPLFGHLLGFLQHGSTYFEKIR